MTLSERHMLILNVLESSGKVSVSHLSELAHVSEMTIRRDLEALERDGLLRRVHGGAVSTVSLSYEPPFSVRAQRNAETKARLAAKAGSLIADGETVILDVGTTVTEVARAIRGRKNLTVFTANLWAADLLADEPGINLMVSGGKVRPGERSLVGDYATHAFKDLVFDTFIMGIAAIDGELGFTEYNLEDAHVKRAALRAARRCIVVADSSKLAKVAFSKVCPLDGVDILVTDAGVEKHMKMFEMHEIEVVIA